MWFSLNLRCSGSLSICSHAAEGRPHTALLSLSNFQLNKMWSYYYSSMKRGHCGDPVPILQSVRCRQEILKGLWVLVAFSSAVRQTLLVVREQQRRLRDTSAFKCSQWCRLIVQKQVWTDISLFCLCVWMQFWTDIESDCQRECTAVWSISGGRGCPSFRMTSLILTLNALPPLKENIYI